MVYDPWGGALEHYGVWVYVENGLVSDGLVRAIGKQPRGICKEATHDAFADENSIRFMYLTSCWRMETAWFNALRLKKWDEHHLASRDAFVNAR